MNATLIVIAFGVAAAVVLVIMGVLKAAKTISAETAGAPTPATTAAAPKSEGSDAKKPSERKAWITGKDIVEVLNGLPGIILALVLAVFVLNGGIQETLRGDASSKTAGQKQESGARGSDAVRTTSTEKHSRIVAATHTVRVPLNPGRSEWRQLPDGYEALPSPDLDSTPALLNMYCADRPSGLEWQWTREHRCIGGWISFSLPRAPDLPDGHTETITYRVSRVGS